MDKARLRRKIIRIILIAVSIVLITRLIMIHSGPAMFVKAEILHNMTIQSYLGDITESGLSVHDMRLHWSSSDFVYQAKGKKDTGLVSMTIDKENGKWRVIKSTLELKDGIKIAIVQ